MGFTGGAFALGLLVLCLLSPMRSGLWLWGTGLNMARGLVGHLCTPTSQCCCMNTPQKAHITRASLAPILPWRTGLCPTASPALVLGMALCRHYGAPQIDWDTWRGEKVGAGSRDRRARDPPPPSRAWATGPSLPTILQWTSQM